MRVVLCCATARGLRVLDRLAGLLRGERLTVVSFREEPGEPPFFDAIADRAAGAGAEFVETRRVGSGPAAGWSAGPPPDLLIAVSWRYLIPRAVFERPRLGSVVFHDSLLPEYRGFAPTVWAVVNGAARTGATPFHMTDGVDAGDLIDQRAVPIGPDDTIREVMDRVTESYLDLLTTHWGGLLGGTAPRTPQDHTRATYTCKRTPDDNAIRWTEPAGVVYNLIRGVTAPYSGAFTTLGGRRLTVWAAARPDGGKRYVGTVPGRVVGTLPGGGAEVLTGDGGSIVLTRVQFAGDEPRAAADVLDRLTMTLGREEAR